MSLHILQQALKTLDQRVLSKKKLLNALKHTTQTYQHRLEELKMEYLRMKHDGSTADVHALKREEDATVDNSISHWVMFCSVPLVPSMRVRDTCSPTTLFILFVSSEAAGTGEQSG